MEWVIGVLVAFGFVLPSRGAQFQGVDPSFFYNSMELICDEGYPVQQHKVISSGYVIAVHRIPNGNRTQRVKPNRGGYLRHHRRVHPDFYECLETSEKEVASGPPVLIQHGLLVASDSWLLQGSGFDLVYFLSDSGYDVWMSNARGNYYSREHLYKSVNAKEFWDFSFHEMATEDIPAVIDYILKTTGHKQLYYIGHSMGTVIFFIMGATRPEYMSKIRLSSLLAPVANVSYGLLTPPRSTLTTFVYNLMRRWEKRQELEIMSRVTWFPLLVSQICGPYPFSDYCYDFLISIDGHPHYNVLRKNFTRMAAHLVSGMSAKTLHHFFQVLYTQRFQQFDYGSEENFRRYRQAIPPEYDVSLVSAPVALYYSDADVFADASQTEVLSSRLPNVVRAKLVKKFIHTDFIIASNAREKLYFDVLNLMNQF